VARKGSGQEERDMIIPYYHIPFGNPSLSAWVYVTDREGVVKLIYVRLLQSVGVCRRSGISSPNVV